MLNTQVVRLKNMSNCISFIRVELRGRHIQSNCQYFSPVSHVTDKQNLAHAHNMVAHSVVIIGYSMNFLLTPSYLTEMQIEFCRPSELS